MLQAWLLTAADAEPAAPDAGDCNGDGRLTAADLSLLKREIMP